MTPSALGKPLLFVATSDVVDIYLQRGKQKMVGQITGLAPSGIATDAAGNLYVANGMSTRSPFGMSLARDGGRVVT